MRALLLLSCYATAAYGLEIREDVYEERAQFVITTRSAAYWLDRAGGGLSRLIDAEGRDWISFKKEPLNQFPASAAAGYRGIPNAVFKQDADAGAGHAGFDRCESEREGRDSILTRSKSGRWAWRWTFTEQALHLRFITVPADATYWMLYEGTPAGRYSPADQFWGSDMGPGKGRPGIKSQHFGAWRWAWFGDVRSAHVLTLAQMKADTLEDAFWWMGSQGRAEADAPDGMVVFGFGRGPSGALLSTQQDFIITFVKATESTAPEKVRLALTPLLQPAR